MQKIVPHFWFDAQAVEAAEFYTNVFPHSKILSTSVIKGTPSGDCDIVDFELMGFQFEAISAGPFFTPNPSISMMVNFDPSHDEHAEQQIDEVWNKLVEGGQVLMPIGEYPYSKRFGWVQDKYGYSWQLILTDPQGDDRPPIMPAFLFVTPECEQAEQASEFYISVFKDAKRGMLERYPAGMEPNKEGSVMFTDFTLEGQWFVASDGSASQHEFSFNEAISFIVQCEDQAEIDYYWEKLSAVPESEQCGWLKDKFGVSWQILPKDMGDLLKKEGATEAMLKMKKIEIVKLSNE